MQSRRVKVNLSQSEASGTMIEEEDTQLSMSTTTPLRNIKRQGSETSNQVGSSRRDGSMIIAFEANSPLLARANEPDSAAAKDGQSLKLT